jgi:hypothetical protein
VRAADPAAADRARPGAARRGRRGPAASAGSSVSRPGRKRSQRAEAPRIGVGGRIAPEEVPSASLARAPRALPRAPQFLLAREMTDRCDVVVNLRMPEIRHDF